MANIDFPSQFQEHLNTGNFSLASEPTNIETNDDDTAVGDVHF